MKNFQIYFVRMDLKLFDSIIFIICYVLVNKCYRSWRWPTAGLSFIGNSWSRREPADKSNSLSTTESLLNQNHFQFTWRRWRLGWLKRISNFPSVMSVTFFFFFYHEFNLIINVLSSVRIPCDVILSQKIFLLTVVPMLTIHKIHDFKLIKYLLKTYQMYERKSW